jgi:hypothetical protein
VSVLMTQYTVEHREDKAVKSVRAFQQAQQRKITQGEEKLQVGPRSCHIGHQPGRPSWDRTLARLAAHVGVAGIARGEVAHPCGAQVRQLSRKGVTSRTVTNSAHMTRPSVPSPSPRACVSFQATATFPDFISPSFSIYTPHMSIQF